MRRLLLLALLVSGTAFGQAALGPCLMNGSDCGTTGAPGGATTQVQYNDGGVLNGSTAFTFQKASGAVSGTGPWTLTPGADFAPLTVRAYSSGTSAILQWQTAANGALGNISHTGAITAPSITLTTGAAAGSVLTSDAGGAATLQLGAANTTTAGVSQTLRAQGAITTADTAGGNLTLESGAGTGTGDISSVILRAPIVAAAGSTQQTMGTVLSLNTSSVTKVGYLAGNGNTGASVTATGYNAAQANTGTYVTATGMSAASSNTGAYVTATGAYAAYSNTGASVTATGYNAAFSNTGTYVTATGYQSGQSLDIYGRFAPLVGAWAAAKVGSGALVTARTYKVLYTLDGVDTELSSTALTVAAGTASTSIDHTGIPVYGGPKVCSGRKVYKKKAADSLYYLVGTIADNTTTTYSDTQPDATYGTVAATPANTMVWGAHATTWGANELAIGSSANPVDNIYLGGQYHLTPATAGRDATVSVMGGNGTDKAGGKLTLRGGKGTGTGAGGAIALQTSLSAASTGSGANIYGTRYYIHPQAKTLTIGSATNVLRIDFPALSTVSLSIQYNVTITDSAATVNVKSHSGRYYFSAYRQAAGSAVASAVVETGETNVASTGSNITDTITVTGDATGIIIAQNAAEGSGLTAPTVGKMTWQIEITGTGAATVSPL